MLLSALIKEFGLDFIDWKEVFKEVLPPKILDMNLKLLD